MCMMEWNLTEGLYRRLEEMIPALAAAGRNTKSAAAGELYETANQELRQMEL